MSEVELLMEARELISDPERWCQGHIAENDTGIEVSPLSPDAKRFCAAGSICNVMGVRHAFISNAWETLGEAASGLFGRSVTYVNDDYSHADVLRMFDRAIEIAKARSSRI